MHQIHELPSGWVFTTIGEIAQIIREHIEPRGSPKTEFNYLSIENIEANTGELINFKPTKGRDIGSAKIKFTNRDLLYSKLRPYLNKVYLPSFNGISATDLIPLRPKAGISREYLAYYLRTRKVVEHLNSKVHGIQLPRVSINDILNTAIPLAPPNEQNRIVTKIEDLLMEIKTAKQSLKETPLITKKCRESVLISAFSGSLIPSGHDGKIEDLEEQIIVNKRRDRASQRPDRAKNKTLKLAPEVSEELPELPRGWIWTTFEMVCSKVQDGTHFSPKIQYEERRKDTYLYITAKNIKDDGIDLANVTYVDRDFHRGVYEHCNPEKGDILLTKDGAKTGVATINMLDEEFSILSSVALFKPIRNSIVERFLLYYLKSPLGFKMITGQMTGTAIKRIILDKIRSSPIPIPPLPIQLKIVTKIEELLSLAKIVENRIATAKARVDMLDQSMLSKAFRGELVQQDPYDEPASVLLERITKEAASNTKKHSYLKRLM